MTHTLAAGAPPQAAFAGLPGRTGVNRKSLTDLSMFFAGAPGSGKTTLLSTIPESFGFNWDGSSINHPRAVSQVFSPSNWDETLQAKAALIKLAENKSPRPKIIWGDSVAGAISMLDRWVPANAKALGISSENKGSFRELHGPAAWDASYGQLARFIDDLRAAGYAVIFTGHIINQVIPLGDDKSIYKPDFTFGAGLWRRLYWKFEMVPVFLVRHAIERITTYKKLANRDGTTTDRPHVTDVPVRQHWIVFDDPAYTEIAKTRVPLDAIQLSKDTPWDDFVTAYNKALQEKPNVD